MMEERKTYTTEDAIKEAERYIIKNDISDEDAKQTIYLLALEYANKKQEGYKMTFNKYLTTNAAKSIINQYEYNNDYDDLSSIIYNIDSKICKHDACNLLNKILSDMNELYQKIIYERFVNKASLYDLAEQYAVTIERIRALETHAIRCIRKELINEYHIYSLYDIL